MGRLRQVASFVLPLGYSFNLDGSMMYCTFATLFIARVSGIHLSIGQRITMLLLLMVTSKGMAGVPRASLVVIAATLAYFDLPEEGLLLILAVDHLLDMPARSGHQRGRQLRGRRRGRQGKTRSRSLRPNRAWRPFTTGRAIPIWRKGHHAPRTLGEMRSLPAHLHAAGGPDRASSSASAT